MSLTRKVIVIGLDGLEPTIVDALLAAGQLPNLALLRSQGSYSRLDTTFPAQTPVAWSTFATGVNPGGHGIFDFLARDPQSYHPRLALNRYEQTRSFLPPRVVNGRGGTPLWQRLSAAGIRSTIVRCPCTFPPDQLQGRLLAGMGVPDLRGGFGTSTFYSTAADLECGESEQVRNVTIDGDHRIQTSLIGPRNPRTGADLLFPIEIHIDHPRREIRIRSGGQPAELHVRLGEWSDWLHVAFKAGLLTSVHGMARFHLVRLEPHFELYVSPFNFDPATPLFPISSPRGYAKELATAVGMFYTTGMVEDHNGLNNGRYDESVYLDQCQQVLAERERMLLHELDRHDQGLFFILFDTPDRLQHMFWRFREPEHPANRGRQTGDWSRAIEEHYVACDAIVGRALAHADESTLFIVLSDHGFGSFQRGVNLNSWLREQGLLTLTAGMTPGPETKEFLHGVDWGKTQAYALGLGGIYLNLAGREGHGVVSADEAPELRRRIAAQLGDLRDPERGVVGIRGAVPREQIYHGPYLSEAPDIVVNFARGYRASWATALGGVAECTWEDNTKRWSGDHIIDPLLIPGVLFMNRPLRQAAPHMADLAPTILAAFGLPLDDALEGKPLLT